MGLLFKWITSLPYMSLHYNHKTKIRREIINTQIEWNADNIISNFARNNHNKKLYKNKSGRGRRAQSCRSVLKYTVIPVPVYINLYNVMYINFT